MNFKIFVLGLAFFAFCDGAIAQEFELRHGETIVPALNFGQGDHVVIALHGLVNTRDIYKGHGEEISKAGIRVIAINWRGKATGSVEYAPADKGFNELRAAIGFAREQGAKKVSLIAFSRGAELAASYARMQPDGEFDTVVLLSSVDNQAIALSKTKKLFIFNRGDSDAYGAPMGADKSTEPKQVIVLGGSGHQISALVAVKADLMQDVIAALKR